MYYLFCKDVEGKMTLITWKISITLKIYLKSKTKCRKCLSHNKWTTRYHFSWFQDTKESVNLLLQLADGFVAKGNLHAASIRQWCTAVDKRYKDFSSRMDRYRHKLESKLGVKEQVPVCIQTTIVPPISIHLYNNKFHCKIH